MYEGVPRVGSDSPPDPFREKYEWTRLDVPQSYALRAEQWQAVFQMFTHEGDLTPAEIALWHAYPDSILQVALRGILRVVRYGNGALNFNGRGKQEARRLPALSEARGHRDIYPRACMADGLD